MPKLHLYFHTPVPIFKARVNMVSTTYPVSAITFDNVTLGAYTDIAFDMTLLLGTTDGGDDLGRVRVQKPATSSIIYVARSSRGFEDGQLDIDDNAYITIFEDFRVWARLPYFDLDAGLDYKDGDVEVGDYNTDIPPVANTGSAFADYIDSGTGVITVQFPNDGVDLSYAMADGATIDTYAWDVQDGTITVGTASDAVITATFPAGFRYVGLTVTDSNGVSHSARVPVLAVDPDDDPTIRSFNISQSLQWNGQTIDVNIHDELSRSDYPDGTLVMFWWDGPESPGDRSHMKFVGWVDNESYNISRDKKGLTKATTLHCVDVCGRLAALPGFPQAVFRQEETDEEGNPALPWGHMPSLDMNKNLWYLGFWHSTAINLADFILPLDGDDYDTMRLDSGAASLYEQMSQQAQKMVPDHYFCCNAKGQMIFQRDWRLDDVGDRPTSAPIITEDYWNDLRIDYNRHPKVHVLRSGAVLVSTDFIEVDGEETLPLAFSVAPSDAQAFGQGVQEHTENEGLALSQEALNKCEGHRYAMLNSRYGDFTLRDPSGYSFWDYEPAAFNRVQLNIPAALAAQRGLDFTQASGIIKSITVQYQTDRRGTVVQPSAVWMKETSGYPALTHNPEDIEDVGYTPPAVYVPPDFGDPSLFTGDIAGYVMWGSDRIFRTWDLQDASPTWEFIDSGVTGSVHDIQYVNVSATVVGAWLMTSAGIWWCEDIMETTPVWTQKLSQATIAAGEVAPPSGATRPRSMFHYWKQPGHLCVATGPNQGSLDWDYEHAYFWVTEDFGDTWTTVDMNAFILSNSGYTSGYYIACQYGMNIFRSEPGTIFCVREAFAGLTQTAKVFISEDLGYTWSEGVAVTIGSSYHQNFSLLHPFPALDDPSWVVSGTFTTNTRATLQKSIDEWATKSDIAASGTPAGYNGVAPFYRVNKRTFDNDHLICWMIKGTNPNFTYDLMQTEDGGSTWTALYSVLGASNTTGADREHVSTALYNTPNGWPPDIDQWVLVKSTADATPSELVLLTLDNFATAPSDKTGNLASLVTPWTARVADGFALPRIGVNA